MALIRVLFVSDTHLGFDMPFRPRVKKRRRGPDFFANFERALAPALKEEVDCVVHGGDILFRSKVPAALVEMAFRPLKKVAETGVPVFVVPGNHERSRIPFRLLASDPNIHIFDSPKSFAVKIRGAKVLFAGFPYFPTNVRKNFLSVLENTNWQRECAELKILCVHHCFEGAKVGPHNYTFKYNNDVIRVREIPHGFAAVLSGHIHRRQILTSDLYGEKTNCPVFYSGSTERTTFAEKDEEKGYLILEFDTERSGSDAVLSWRFCALPTRPMMKTELDVSHMKAADISEWLKKMVASIDKDAIINIDIRGAVGEAQRRVLNNRYIRSIFPETVNFNLVFKDFIVRRRENQSYHHVRNKFKTQNSNQSGTPDRCSASSARRLST